MGRGMMEHMFISNALFSEKNSLKQKQIGKGKIHLHIVHNFLGVLQ